MKINRFEDLEIWQKARLLVGSIYKLTSTSKLNKDYGLKDQMQRAAVSIMNNIAEGFERNSNKEFIRFLNFPKGSAGEIRSLLYVTLDLKMISENEFVKLREISEVIIKRISSLIKYLRSKA